MTCLVYHFGCVVNWRATGGYSALDEIYHKNGSDCATCTGNCGAASCKTVSSCCKVCTVSACLFKGSMGEDLASAFCMTFERTNLARHAQLELPASDLGTLYIVRSGALMVHLLFPDGRRNVLDFRYEGELFYTAHNSKRAGTTLQAVDDTRLMIIPQEIIAELSRDFPDIVQRLVLLAAAQIEESAVHNLILNRLTAEERISSFLLNLAVRTGRQLIDRVEFILPMNRADIADFLGLNAETVSRVLTKLKKSGIIELPRPGEAYIEDMPRLARLTPIASAICDTEEIDQKAVFT